MAPIVNGWSATLNAANRFLVIRKMNDINLDLESLRFFCALMDTGGLNRAASRLDLSQPAASRLLNRLRGMFDDQLFIKAGLGMSPTPRAVALAPAIREALGKLEALVVPEVFEPATSRRLFRIAAVDNAFLIIVGRVLPEFLRLAPQARIDVRPLEEDLFEQLREGRVDVSIFPKKPIPPDLHCRMLFSSDYVCLLRKDHPLVAATPPGEAPSIEEFSRYPRASLRVPVGREVRTVEQRALVDAYASDPAVQTPYFLGMPMVLVDSDLVMLIMRPTALRFAAFLPLAILPAPTAFAPHCPSLVWHHRVHSDPGVRWLRELFFSARY